MKRTAVLSTLVLAASALVILGASTAKPPSLSQPGPSLQLLVEDRKRPSWVVRWVDEPLFVHWGACAYGLALSAVAVVALGMAGKLAGSSSAGGLGELVSTIPTIAMASYLLALPLAAWSVWGIRRRLRVRLW